MSCPNWLRVKPIAHRGLHLTPGAPENSLAAFAAAANRECPIELDVQLSSDGALVVFHDYTLERATNSEGHVSQTSVAKLKLLSLFGSAEKIPLLEEVFSVIDGKVPILIEVKNEGLPGFLERALSCALADYKGEVALQSFNPYSVKWFRKNLSQISCGQISGSFSSRRDISPWRRFILSNVILAPLIQPDFISYELAALTNARRLLFTRAYDLPLLFWTVRSLKDARFARQMGGNIIFENFLPITNASESC